MDWLQCNGWAPQPQGCATLLCRRRTPKHGLSLLVDQCLKKTPCLHVRRIWIMDHLTGARRRCEWVTAPFTRSATDFRYDGWMVSCLSPIMATGVASLCCFAVQTRQGKNMRWSEDREPRDWHAWRLGSGGTELLNNGGRILLDVSGIHRLYSQLPNLLLFDFFFNQGCRGLQEVMLYNSNLQTSSHNQSGSKISTEREIRHNICFTEV
jgi:hypothetical protein